MPKDILYPLRRLHGILHEQRNLYKYRRTLKKFKGIHKGQRCFIIGNGPSLRIEDLSKLKNDICFGSHRIYCIYEQTEWRPTYYCAQDQKLIRESRDQINSLVAKEKFIAYMNPYSDIGILKDKRIRILCKEFYPDLPQFSEKLEEGVFEGFTVTYMCLQIAAYMGFSEIYLLGIDHSYSVSLDPNGKLIRNENIKDHFSDLDTITNIPQTYKSTLAYVAAKKYADQHDIKIYNATRGGALEVFDRISFDDIAFIS